MHNASASLWNLVPNIITSAKASGAACGYEDFLGYDALFQTHFAAVILGMSFITLVGPTHISPS
jgi:hypothetical protein